MTIKNGFVSFENLEKRLENARRFPEKKDDVAFNVYSDARNPDRFVVAMYVVEGKKLSSVGACVATGHPGRFYARLSLRDVIEDFGQNGEDAFGLFRNVNKLLNSPLPPLLNKPSGY